MARSIRSSSRNVRSHSSNWPSIMRRRTMSCTIVSMRLADHSPSDRVALSTGMRDMGTLMFTSELKHWVREDEDENADGDEEDA